MSDPLNHLLLRVSSEPERLIEVLEGIASELSRHAEGNQTSLDSLAEDFSLAMGLAEQLIQTQDAKERVEGILNRMPMAMVIVDPNAEVQGLNEEAKQLLTEQVFVCVDDGVFRACHTDTQQEFETLLQQYRHSPDALNSPVGLNFRSVEQTESTVSCMLYRQNRFSDDDQSPSFDLCLLFHNNQHQFERKCIEHFAEAHALTPSECALLIALCEGKTPADFAEQRFVSVHTVRTQLKTVFRKTGTQRQAQLVRAARAYDQAVNLLSQSTNEANNQDKTLLLADGRQLAYRELGDPGGEVVVHCHGVLTSRLEPIDGSACRAAGLRLIIPDRPGYGKSDPNPNHSLKDWALDLEALLDALGLQEVNMLAADLSSSYALAAAYTLGKRIRTVILLDGAAPIHKTTRHDIRVPTYYRTLVFFARRLPKVIHKTTSVAYTFFCKDPEKAFMRFSEIIGELNAQVVCKPQILPKLLKAIREAGSQGVNAIAENQILLFSDWHIPLHQIESPVLLFAGENDALAQYHRDVLESELVHVKVVPCSGQSWANLLYESLPQVFDIWRSSYSK